MRIDQLDPMDRKMLMVLQYEFPFSAIDPYETVAEKLGISVDEMLQRLQALKKAGIVKRIGFYLNPRSRRRSVALIAFKGGSVDVAEKLCREDDEITHCYEREGGGDWRIWIVRRAPSMEGLLEWASAFARKIGAVRFEILEATRVYRLSVKYDLYEGVSRAGPYTRVVLNPPSPEELGIEPSIPRDLRSLPLEPRPYHRIAEKHGLPVEQMPRIVELLLEKGILGDPGLVLDGHRLGFSYNGMVIVKPVGEVSKACEVIVEKVPEATHIVSRRAYPPDTRSAWAPTCYAMIHAVSREKLDAIYRRIQGEIEAREIKMLISVRDLKPGAER